MCTRNQTLYFTGLLLPGSLLERVFITGKTETKFSVLVQLVVLSLCMKFSLSHSTSYMKYISVCY